ncbi:hypothetical protein BCR37DRAFT_277385 [Protomyces lactucae-debilis]|uniref:WIBG Mago-binding domain-containing protein n=1 Tax=Protomyces lactucae-debilis TaxID=2754530 RepID=A0A1Y2FIF7_PROLT|nr:uncharacterized protein BCR37DRAFT_277385 [Protomyces lactucae-debilis]ORY83729.1 hypothetical protein BCR37DRAFT_277385 [Protomyces lactucae-debilis]
MSTARNQAIRNSGITTDGDGSNVVPSSRRADGSARREIKIRPGYVPEEDRERYKPPRRRAVLPETDELAEALGALDIEKPQKTLQIKGAARRGAEGLVGRSRTDHGDDQVQTNRNSQGRLSTSHGSASTQKSKVLDIKGAADRDADLLDTHNAPDMPQDDKRPSNQATTARDDTSASGTIKAHLKPPWHQPPMPPPSVRGPEDPSARNKRLVGILSSQHEAMRAEREIAKGRLATVDLVSPAKPALASKSASSDATPARSAKSKSQSTNDVTSAMAALDVKEARQPATPPQEKPQTPKIAVAATGTWGKRMTPAEFAEWRRNADVSPYK